MRQLDALSARRTDSIRGVMARRRRRRKRVLLPTYSLIPFEARRTGRQRTAAARAQRGAENRWGNWVHSVGR